MTYAQLLNRLYKMPKDRLEDTVTVFDPSNDEFLPVITTGEVHAEKEDRLDPGHCYLVI